MIFTFLLSCCKHFQHALLKAFFHNIAMTTLIEHAHAFLYMQSSNYSNTYIGSYAPGPHVQACYLSSWIWPKPTKKRTAKPSIHVYFISLITISYKTNTKHNEKPYKKALACTFARLKAF